MNKKYNLLMIFLCLLLPITTASAAVFTFSFASDSDSDGTGPIFEANGCNINASIPLKVELLADTNADLPGGVISIFSEFRFRGEIRNYVVIPMFGNFLHTWEVSGGMEFDNGNVLTARFAHAVLTSYSTGANRLGETITLQDDETVDPNITIVPGPVLTGAGIPNLHFQEEFAFTFTKINSPVFIAGPCFIDPWRSHGSFSASASD